MNILLVVVCVIGLVGYGIYNWPCFRRWLELCLPAGLLSGVVVSWLFHSPDFWRNVIGGAFLGLMACAFLTYISKAQEGEDKS